jgi:hypothetical protein
VKQQKKLAIDDSEFVNVNYGRVEHALASLDQDINALS